MEWEGHAGQGLSGEGREAAKKDAKEASRRVDLREEEVVHAYERLESRIGSVVMRDVSFEGQECRADTDGRKERVADLGQGGGDHDVRIGVKEKVCGCLRYVRLAYSLMYIAATCGQSSGIDRMGRVKKTQPRYS